MLVCCDYFGLVHLKRGNDQPPCALKQFLVRPFREFSLQPPGLNVVPTEEDEPEAEQSRVLVYARVAQNEKPFRIHQPMDLRGWRVDQRDVGIVEGRIAGHWPFQQSAILEGTQRSHPGFLCGVEERGINPTGPLVDLLPRRIQTMSRFFVVFGTGERNFLQKLRLYKLNMNI